jgi:hypothetical protein
MADNGPQGAPASKDAKQILTELLNELRGFSAATERVRRRLAHLPEPLSALLVLPLRNAEDLRHGTDHLIHALKWHDDPDFVKGQLCDARAHLLNLLPDFFMHVSGSLLRWSADALLQAGLLGKGRVEEKDIEELIKRFADARLARTGKRDETLREAEAILQDAIDLAPRVLALTVDKQREQQTEITRLQKTTSRSRLLAWVSATAIIVGLVVWML